MKGLNIMAKGANQKLKLLYIARYLLEQTNEEHPATVANIIDHLAANDISAERKSIYADLEALRNFGMDIIQSRSKSTGYYIGGRQFELAELKLLVDSVQSSKFVPYNKSLNLIKKIESLAGVHDAKALHRQVFVLNRVKTLNDSIFYNIDAISNAINHDKMIQFRYFEYTVSKEKHFRKDGGFYQVSPYALIWDDENYYVLAWDSTAQMQKHFRVDKMQGISAMEQNREGSEHFENMDTALYAKKVFAMFGGREETVKLRFSNILVSAVIDRFGSDIIIAPSGDSHFTVTLDVEVSPQFRAWLCGFGKNVEVLYPDSVRQEMKTLAEDLAELYK